MRSTHSALITELARPCDGVITQAQLVAAGVRAELASRQVAAQRWQRLLPGVYLTRRGLPTLHQRCYAALAYAGPAGVVSGAAGWLLRDLPNGDSDDTSVTVLLPSRVRRSSAGFCHVVRPKAMPGADLLRREGRADLPVAPAERCVADAIRRASALEQARARAQAALRLHGLDWVAVARQASRRGPGAGHLGRVVREIADGVRSVPEAEVHDVVGRAARRGVLPPYLLNPDVYVDGVLLGSPDLWVVGLGLGHEVDSRAWHEEAGALDRTLLRHETFGDHGLHLLHSTPARFRADPEALVSRLRQACEGRGQLATPEPAGLRVLGRGPLLPERTPWPQVPGYRWR